MAGIVAGRPHPPRHNGQGDYRDAQAGAAILEILIQTRRELRQRAIRSRAGQQESDENAQKCTLFMGPRCGAAYRRAFLGLAASADGRKCPDLTGKTKIHSPQPSNDILISQGVIALV